MVIKDTNIVQNHTKSFDNTYLNVFNLGNIDSGGKRSAKKSIKYTDDSSENDDNDKDDDDL